LAVGTQDIVAMQTQLAAVQAVVVLLTVVALVAQEHRVKEMLAEMHQGQAGWVLVAAARVLLV
jgi:hypothetical protein